MHDVPLGYIDVQLRISAKEKKYSYIVFSINFYSRHLNSYERLFSEADPWGTRDEFLQKDDGVTMDRTGVHR